MVGTAVGAPRGADSRRPARIALAAALAVGRLRSGLRLPLDLPHGRRAAHLPARHLDLAHRHRAHGRDHCGVVLRHAVGAAAARGRRGPRHGRARRAPDFSHHRSGRDFFVVGRHHVELPAARHREFPVDARCAAGHCRVPVIAPAGRSQGGALPRGCRRRCRRLRGVHGDGGRADVPVALVHGCGG